MMPAAMTRQIPNALTVGRLALAGVFFVMLGLYQFEGRGDPTFLNIAFAIYLIAAATDFLDGYLARRWGVTSRFGRIVDPFCDKILVLGSFTFFAGKNFIVPDSAGVGHEVVVRTITGVYPGFVVILLARELFVTTLRGVSEGGGTPYGAAFAGKLKMTVQAVTIGVILTYVNYFEGARPDVEWWARMARDGFIWATLAVTVWSGLAYVRRLAPRPAPSEQPRIARPRVPSETF